MINMIPGTGYEDTMVLLRLLECWLPLAQEANQVCGWGYDAASLEALVLSAVPSLHQSHNRVTALAVLWYHHQHIHKA